MSEELNKEIDQFELSPEELENAISVMDGEQIDEFDSSTVNFDKFVVLSKKELQNFCRIVEPLTKASIDDYGKSVFIRCVDDDVELVYYNDPYSIVSRVSNRSKKQIKSFAMSVATLKRITTSAFASVILVEDNDDINLFICEQLLYLETKPLHSSVYQFEQHSTDLVIDKELAHHTFRKMGAILSLTDRASEKLIVIKNGMANFNTGVFTSRSKSPFGESEDFVVYKQVSDVIGILSEISKTTLNYSIEGSFIYVSCDEGIWCKMPIAVGSKVQEYISPTADIALGFNASVVIVNDSLIRLLSTVKSLDYLNNIVTIGFTSDKMYLDIVSTNNTKKSRYEFTIVEGTTDIQGEMKLGVDVLLTFLQIVGVDVKYQFTDVGFGIKNDIGTFLIRKS